MTSKQKSIVAMIFSTLGFALMGVFLKLTGDIPIIQKVVFRTVIILMATLVMMYQNKVKIRGRHHHGLLILRSLTGTGGILMNYYAVDHLLLSDASVLFRLSTFILILFSWIFLGEKISLYQMLSVSIAFIGVLFVVKPQFSVEIFPYLIAIAGATFAAGAYTALRVLGQKEHPLFSVFYFASFTTIVLLPFFIIRFVPMTGIQVLYAVLAGLSATIGQVGISVAYKYAPAKEVSIYGYLGILFSAVFSIFIFGSEPDIFSYIGYVIIFGSAYYMYSKNKEVIDI